jgi:hypothetical protein
LKEGVVPLRRIFSFHGGVGIYLSVGSEVEFRHGAPWYKRSPRIIWEDVKRTGLRPLRRWQHRRAEERRRARQPRSTPAKVSTHAVHFADPRWSETPALSLLSGYLDTLSALVAAAETRFRKTQEEDRR